VDRRPGAARRNRRSAVTGAGGGPQVVGPQTPLEDLPGVTSSRAAAFERMGLATVEDLLRLAPRRHEDRRVVTPIADLIEGVDAFVVGTVERSRTVRARGGLAIVEADVRDASGSVPARWFHRGYVPRALPAGRIVALYGAPRSERGALLFHAPALERLGDDPHGDGPGVRRLTPVHPLSRGLTAPFVRQLAWQVLDASDAVEDVVPRDLCEDLGLMPIRHALRQLHFPADEEAAARARRRLAFDELLVHDIALRLRRRATARLPAVACAVPAGLDERIRARFPFPLTPGQDAVVAEIVRDLGRASPMRRLLQGDVGSGKTAVAAYAALAVVAAGRQVALVAPTEILARQHHATLTTWLEGSRVTTIYLGGGRRTRARQAELAALAAGEVDVVVGTHALFEPDVVFPRLGLAVVDEQHRFGVAQRGTLLGPSGDGVVPHLLAMTATPIPRTLALAVHGDVDVSLLEGRLPGRSPVSTWVVRPHEGRAVLERVREALAKDQQVYVVYPLVEESEALALRDAEDGLRRWRVALPDARVELLTGRMKRAEKEAVMAGFRAGDIDVLVATVVVEVGVDVARATVLIVEHAERFGLGQLHQLRGRVGRGTEPGLCVLVDRSPEEGPPARLEVLAQTNDGLRIAEEDLALRGIGDLFGTRQHGRPPFQAADLPRDLPLLTRAREAAGLLLEADPDLAAEVHRPLRRAALALVRRMTLA
jgi:ATP-dependent DNA helicase RecG